MSWDNINVLKEKIYNECLRLVNKQVETLNEAARHAREALASETKSTAGDKHETGRAMIQLEQEKLATQLQEAYKIKATLDKLPYKRIFDVVESGALVRTTNDYYFIAVGLGKTEVEGENVFVVAPSSPVAKLMLGKKVGETIIFNKTTVFVNAIY